MVGGMLSAMITIWGGGTPAEASCELIKPSADFVERVLTDSTGSADLRIALVVGNGDYVATRFHSLQNSRRDAVAIAGRLVGLGFEVYQILDGTAAEIERCRDVARARLEEGQLGLVYFAGHGVQAGGDNYFVAADAVGGHPAGRSGYVSISQILADFRAPAGPTVLLLDACRAVTVEDRSSGGLAAPPSLDSVST